MPTEPTVLSGLVVDGTGGSPFKGWVLLNGDRITAVERAEVAPPTHARARRVTAILPGFIDVHTHSDVTALVAPQLDSHIRQGVTTVVVGNCGTSPGPHRSTTDAAASIEGWVVPDPEWAELRWTSLGEWLDLLTEVRPAVNVLSLVGLGSLRRATLDDPTAPLAPSDAVRLRAALDQALDEGAAGLSTGLIYEPDQHTTTEEIVQLTRGMRGLYVSHIRGEGAGVRTSVAELVDIGRRAQVPVHVSHLKCEGRAVWGTLPRLLEDLRRARASGVNVSADAYPYAAWQTGLAAFLPPWCPSDRLAATVASPGERHRLRLAVEHGESSWQSSVEGVGWERIVVDGSPDNPAHGRRLTDLGDGFDVMVQLLLEDPGTLVIGHAMREDDVMAALVAPEVMVASDGVGLPLEGPLSAVRLHPRCWGTFPRALGQFVGPGRASLEQMVRSMTQLPALRFGLEGRGVLRPGAMADLVCLDPAAVDGPADFERPNAPPIGLEEVWVNGRLAWSTAEPGSERHGQVLRSRH